MRWLETLAPFRIKYGYNLNYCSPERKLPMNNVYLAAPFFDDAQKQRIEQVKAALKANPTVNSDGIFIPEEHQFEE